jgi:photoactive yellow protein
LSEKQLPSFDTPALAKAVEQLTPEQIDRLPFGAIHLDPNHRVVSYSQSERRLSGFGNRPAVGLDFFQNIAPCMDVDNYRGRVERALKAGTVDIEFNHIGDFDDRARDLHVRIQSAADGGCWIFMNRA